MRLAQLRDFIAVADIGSISGAAKKLAISQPALTKSMHDLEHQLGVELLVRTSHGVALTRYGKVLLERARRAQSELAQAEQEIAQMAGKHADQVAFGVGPFVAMLLVPTAFEAFRKCYAIDKLRVVEGFVHVLVPLVRQGVLDFAIGPKLTTQTEAGVLFKPLFQHEQIVVGRAGHPLSGARTFSELLTVQWLSFEPRTHTQVAFTQLGLVPPPIVECESYSAFTRILNNTDMLGMASMRMIAEQPLGVNLQRIQLLDHVPALSVGIYSRMDGQMTPAIEAMAKAIIEGSHALASRTAGLTMS